MVMDIGKSVNPSTDIGQVCLSIKTDGNTLKTSIIICCFLQEINEY